MKHQFAHTYVKKSIVHLREIFTVGTLQVPTTPTKLKELESIHKVGLYFVSVLSMALCLFVIICLEMH